MKVLFVHRSKLLNVFSIERCFQIIQQSLPSSVKIVNCYLPFYDAGIRSIIKNSLYVRAIQKKEKCDIVHITGDVHYTALFLKKRQTILTIHDVGGIHLYCGIKCFLYKILWLLIPLLKSQVVVAISSFTANEIKKTFPFFKSELTVIPDPIGESFVPYKHDFKYNKPRILMIGTAYNKNVERSILALKNIHCTFNIVGKLSNMQKKMLLQNKIDYINEYSLNDNEILKRYIECDLVLFPSTYEGFGMIIIESQSVGRPIITSNIEPMVEVSGGAACLVNPYDVESIHQGILKVISNPVYQQDLVARGFENAKKYKSSRIASLYCDLYDQINKSSN